MNEYDSELIRGLFEKAGYEYTDELNEADVVLFNTCSVREHAEARVWGQVGMLKKLNEPRTTSHKPRVIGIVGCMAQNYQDKIFKKLPHVNLVCGTGNLYELPHLAEMAKKTGQKILAVKGNQRPHAIGSAGVRRKKLKAFVTIVEGCDNYCSYCIVPYVRGKQISRRPQDILEEIKDLVECGTKEVTLLGQNVNSYGQDLNGSRVSFIELLIEVSKIKGLKRIRFTTNHPKDTSIELIKLMAKDRKVCPHLHLPLQSGSDHILKMMNRNYTASQYLKLVNLYRKFVREGSLTTDIIVGFPGEKDEDFKATFDLMKKIAFDSAFIFKYSPRPPATSSRSIDEVPTEIKKERNQLLIDLQKKISLNKNRLYLNRKVEILVEGYDKSKKKLIGRTPSNKITVFNGEDKLIGETVEVEIKDVTENTLIASLSR
jgi:tRNA-2-methylthio-N6-dimethylallyladenosine synthase